MDKTWMMARGNQARHDTLKFISGSCHVVFGRGNPGPRPVPLRECSGKLNMAPYSNMWRYVRVIARTPMYLAVRNLFHALKDFMLYWVAYYVICEDDFPKALRWAMIVQGECG